MTKKTKVGLIGAGSLNRSHIKNITFRTAQTDLVAFLALFTQTAESYLADCPLPTVYNDHHPILTHSTFNTIPICPITNIHAQLTKEPGSTHSISFPPFYVGSRSDLLLPISLCE